MGSNESANVVVLGGGLSGLCVAWNLVQDGYRVVVLEKEPVYGGQSITFKRGGFHYDLGPHNIHTQRDGVIRFLQDSLQGELVRHEFFSEIFFQNKRIKYPFFGDDLLRSVSPVTAFACALSFIYSRGSSLFMPSFKDDGSYETWIVNRFGRKMFDLFFGPYSEKVWKISTKDLSDIVAQKRISVKSIFELIHSAFFKAERFHPENPRLVACYYPRMGAGVIADFLARGITEQGGQIITRAAVTELTLTARGISRVAYTTAHGEDWLDLVSGQDNPTGQVVSTIPINEMVLMMRGEIPSVVHEAAAGLDFTAEVFLYLDLKQKDAFQLPLFYFSSPEFPFNRIYDVGIFSRHMVPERQTALCLEISCDINDEFWNMTDAELFEICITPLERHGLLARRMVEDFHSRRLAHAYPRFRIGYERKVQSILDFIDQKVPNLISLGRQGLFSYANIDDAIWMGFEVAKHMRYRERMPLLIKELLPDYINT